MEKKLNARAALDLIAAGLQSGSIKLRGSVNAGDVESAQELAEMDAAYLNMLLTRLTGETVNQPAPPESHS
jgi:hypothetical protein